MAQPSGPRRGSIWRTLALDILALVVLSLVGSFADARILAVVTRPVERTALDVLLAIAWILVAALAVNHGRHRLADERDHRRQEGGRAWNLGLNLFLAFGYAYLLLVALALLHVNLSGILVGGAVTGIVLGIAAQSALGNLFGGMLVLLLHPYSVGERITVRSSSFGGVEYSGTVREVTLFYTSLDADGGRLVIPNSLTVASVVRVEPVRNTQSAVVTIPYRVGADTFAAALAAAGLPDSVRIDAYATDTYTARVEIPADGGSRALLAVLAGLLVPPA